MDSSLSSPRFVACAGAAAIALPAPAVPPQFSDRTVDAGLAVMHSTSGYSHANYTGGGAVADFNRDGFQDIFMISGGNGNVPDRLFLNNSGDGTFTDVAAFWGLTAAANIHKGKGAAVGDFNADGWPDLYVTSAGPVSGAAPGHHKLYRNNGNGTFTNIAASAGVDTTTTTVEDGFGAVFGDYDLDGDVDLFVGGFASGNAGSKLFRNNGDETFTDVTSTINLFGATGNTFCFTPHLVDMDGDRYPELLLAADFGTCRYFRNDLDGTFTDLTGPTDTGQAENGMGAVVADFDGNGLPDWYVTSIYLPTINWTGNKLFLNLGSHTYVERAAVAGVDDGGYGWGTVAVDVNHDGLVDIVETNGSPSGTTFLNEQSYLWVQNPDGTYTEQAIASGLDHDDQGRGMASLDLENDGDQDIVIFSYNDMLRLFRNDLDAPDTHWLRVFLDTAAAPGLAPDGLGAVVTATVGGETQTRFIGGGNTHLSHSELSAHFGLGAATVVDELRVDWPDGSSTTQLGVAADQTITIAAGPCNGGDTNGDGVVDGSDVVNVILAWGTDGLGTPGVNADLDGSGLVDGIDLVAAILGWGPCS